jgi:hypothetical protein
MIKSVPDLAIVASLVKFSSSTSLMLRNGDLKRASNFYFKY